MSSAGMLESRSWGAQRLQAWNPARSAASGEAKKLTRSRRGRRLGQVGRQ